MIIVNLFVKYEDLERYERGEIIDAYDSDSKRVLTHHKDNILSVGVNSIDIIGREDVVTRGMVKGTFNKYRIQKM